MPPENFDTYEIPHTCPRCRREWASASGSPGWPDGIEELLFFCACGNFAAFRPVPKATGDDTPPSLARRAAQAAFARE